MTRSSGAPLVAGRVDKSLPWFQAAVATLFLSSPYFAALTAASLAAAAVAADINAAPEGQRRSCVTTWFGRESRFSGAYVLAL